MEREYSPFDVRVGHHPELLTGLRGLLAVFERQVLLEMLRMPPRNNPAGAAKKNQPEYLRSVLCGASTSMCMQRLEAQLGRAIADRHPFGQCGRRARR